MGNRQSVLRATSATAAPFSTTGHSYDTLNRLTDIVNKNGGGAVVSSFHYGLRLDGKRSSVTDSGPATSGGTTNYFYDDQGKLTEEAGPYADIKYGYDNVGNRLTRTVTNAATGNGTTLVNGVTNTAYDVNDRIVGHTYDLDGNETTVNGQAASYDFENHLVSLATAANGTVLASYTYDADSNRVSTYVSSAIPTTTSYVVDTSLPYASVVEEYTGASTTPSARYDYGDDLVRMDRGSGVYYYLYDGLGSTRQLVNTSGAVTDTWGYSAFGELASHTGTTANPFLFNAQQFDGASGDYYLRARYYDQSNGRFVSQDPFAGSNEDPISLHRYLYASGDPVDRVDPSGRSDFGDLLTSLYVTAQINPTATVLVAGVAVFALSAIDPDGVQAVGETLHLPVVEEEASLASSTRGAISNFFLRQSVLQMAEEEEGLFVKEVGDVAQELTQLEKLRSLMGRAGGGTLAKLQINGKPYFGAEGKVASLVNSTKFKLNDNRSTLFHAEGNAFMEAEQDGVFGGDGLLVVDNLKGLCPFCYGSNGVTELARQLGLSSLTIITHNKAKRVIQLK